MPLDPPGAPARPRQLPSRLARGTQPHRLRSRASIESDAILSNSDDSASFAALNMPTRQPVFTSLLPSSAPPNPSTLDPSSLIELQQSQSGTSTNTSAMPQPYQTPTNAAPPLLPPAIHPPQPRPARRRPARHSQNSPPSNSSMTFDSPKNKQLSKVAAQAGPSRSSPHTPHTPHTLQAAHTLHQAVNPDGSLSVIRNDEDANNSGLLDLSPMLPRFAKQRSRAVLFGTPTGLKYGTSPNPLPRPALGKPSGLELEPPIDIHIPTSNGFNPSDKQPRQDEDSIQDDSINIIDDERVEQDQDDDDDDAYDVPLATDTLSRLRRWRHDAMQQHLYETAIFWGDKILSLETSPIAYNDAYHLAQCYFYTHQYARAEHLLTNPLRTGASRHISATATELAASARSKATATSGLLASEHEEDGDALYNALAATRANSQLPSSILARSSTKDSMYSVSTGSKRKERDFNVSATGTASSASASTNGSTGRDDANHKHRPTNKAGNRATAPADPLNLDRDADIDSSSVFKPTKRVRADAQHARSSNTDDADEEHDTSAIDNDLIDVKDKDATIPDGPTLVNHSLACRYLAAQCQVRLAKYHEALELLGDNEQWGGAAGAKKPSTDGGIKLGSSVAFLRGQIHLRLEDLPRARESFMTALALDVKNYEAFSALIDGSMLGIDQQWSFVQGLEYLAQAGDEQGASEDFEFIRLIYTTRLSKQGKTYALNTAAARRRLSSEYGLSNNPDILLGLAEELFAKLRFADAFTVTSRILELSADHPGALPIHIACIYHLKNLRPALFMLAHRLTELDTESPVSWYAVGTWYAATRRWADARRYFSKASLLDPRFAPSWIAFGHTFALEGESDQAITAYSTASRLFPQSHLPRLFIGMEHLHQGNLSLARLSLEGSAQIWHDDPLTANERGVVAYQSNE